MSDAEAYTRRVAPTRATLARVGVATTVALSLHAACSSGGATASGAGGAGTGGHPTTHGTTSGVASGSSSGSPLTPTFVVSGIVTDGTNPLAGAMVLQGGAGAPAAVTGADGAYSITLTQAIPGTPTVVATRAGYRTAGVDFDVLPDGPVEIALAYVTPPDNPGYVYGEPGVGNPTLDNSTAFCGHCHTTLVKQFQASAHAEAARSSLVQDLYAGVSEAYATQAACVAAGGVWRAGLVPGAPSTSMSKCYLGGGVLPDLNPGCGAAAGLACDDPALPASAKPAAFGGCADCHAPGMNGPAGGRNLHDAVGVAYRDGNHCDFCHHVRDVDLTKPAGTAGALILQRPRDEDSPMPGSQLRQVMYGRLLDVTNGFMGGSYQPKFAASELCGGCHEQKQPALLPGAALDPSRWPDGLPTHSTYGEWLGSSYDVQDHKPCQDCHMPPDDTGLSNTVDVTKPASAGIVYGFVHPPDQIRKHVFRDPLDGTPRFIDQAVSVAVSATSNGATLTVQAQVQNTGAGHALPTGEPMRALVLVVDAQACGSAMTPVDGMTVNDVGGAAAAGIVGTGVTFAGAVMTWPAAAGVASPGAVVRVVRPTATYDDYAGVGFFANPALTPKQKGLEIRRPVGEATVAIANGAVLTLTGALAVQAGDLVYLGDALTWPPVDAAPSLALAGRPGYSFARVMVDPGGARSVPHYRAVDIASDNRIPPKATASTTHGFAIPAGCTSATITAALLYRQVPVAFAKLRGWEANDYVIGQASAVVALP